MRGVDAQPRQGSRRLLILSGAIAASTLGCLLTAPAQAAVKGERETQGGAIATSTRIPDATAPSAEHTNGDPTEGAPDQQNSPTLESLRNESIGGAPREAPPPPEPKAEHQYPRTYVPPAELQGKERHVTLMGVAGIWRHGIDGNAANASVGPVWGFSGRVEPVDWLGVRLSILRGNQPMSPDASVLVRPGLSMQQPDFEIIYWSLRMEPTWHVTRAFSLWAGVGVAWARAIVPEPATSDALRSANRAAVYVEGQWALGAQYELVPDWIVLGLDLSTGALGYQKGSAHDPIQAFTTDGHRTHIGGYPNFSRKVQALFGAGVIL